MKAMTVRMSEELSARLSAESDAQAVSVNQAVVIAIGDWLAKRADERAAAIFADIAQERADLLDRLGNA